jgi:hypothetical protein
MTDAGLLKRIGVFAWGRWLARNAPYVTIMFCLGIAPLRIENKAETKLISNLKRASSRRRVLVIIPAFQMDECTHLITFGTTARSVDSNEKDTGGR